MQNLFTPSVYSLIIIWSVFQSIYTYYNYLLFCTLKFRTFIFNQHESLILSPNMSEIYNNNGPL